MRIFTRAIYFLIIYTFILVHPAWAQRELPKDALANAFKCINALRTNPERNSGEMSIEMEGAQKHKALSQSHSLRQYCGKLILDAKKYGPYEIPNDNIENLVKRVQKAEGAKFVEFIVFEQQGPLNGKTAVKEIMAKAFWADALLARNDNSKNYKKIGFALYPAKTKGNYYWVIALTDKTRYNN